MGLYRLHTNEGERVVRSTPERLRRAMYRYIREKRAQGMALSEVVYCWSPLVVSGTV